MLQRIGSAWRVACRMRHIGMCDMHPCTTFCTRIHICKQITYAIRNAPAPAPVQEYGICGNTARNRCGYTRGYKSAQKYIYIYIYIDGRPAGRPPNAKLFLSASAGNCTSCPIFSTWPYLAFSLKCSTS